jgi:hypothetical protein
MRLIITESQYYKIISESFLDTIKNLFPKEKQIQLTSNEIKPEFLKIELPKIATPEDFAEKLKQTNLNFDAFPNSGEGLNFRNPLSFNGTDTKGNIYTFSFTPTENFLNVKVTLSGNKKQEPKKIYGI